MIGLGLGDGDLSLRAMEALKEADKIYAEFYTSPNLFDLKGLEDELENGIKILDREVVEQSDEIIESAREEKTAFLVSGDPLTATTHYELIYQSRKEGIELEVIHAPSIFTAIAETGLSIYKFGRTTTLPRKEGGYLPESPYEVIEKNLEDDFHTLLLIDPGLGLNSTCEILGELEEKKEGGVFVPGRKIFIVSRAGRRDSKIYNLKFGELDRGDNIDLKPPFVILVPAELSHQEEKFSKQFL